MNTRKLSNEDERLILSIENGFCDKSACMMSEHSDIKKCLKSGKSLALFDEQELAGYILYYENEYKTGYIDKVFVSEKYRWQGIQRYLISQVLLMVRVFFVFAMCSPSNAISLRNFKSCGFNEAGNTLIDGYPRTILYRCESL